MKKGIIFVFFLVLLFIIIILLTGKPTSFEISEAITNINGITIFYDKHSKEEVKIIVKNKDGENLENIRIGYIDGKGFEYFQFEDPSRKYMPAMEIYRHHSIHRVTMSLKDEGPIIEEYITDDNASSQAIEMFSNYMFSNPQIVDHGIKTLEEWDDIADTKISMVALFLPLSGSKLKIIGTVRQIIRIIDPNGPYSDPRKKYHMYSYVPFDGITTQIRWFKEVENDIKENAEHNEIGVPIEMNYDLSEPYFPLQVGNYWKYELNKYIYSPEHPDDKDNFLGTSNIEINIDRKEKAEDIECFVFKENSDEKYFYNECGLISILRSKNFNNTGDDILLEYEKAMINKGHKISYPNIFLTEYTYSDNREKVRVKAGKFKNVIKIDKKFSDNNTDIILTEWLAENVGIVKGRLEIVDKIGVPVTSINEWELISYNLKEEDDAIEDELIVTKEVDDSKSLGSEIVIFFGKKLIAYGSERVISLSTQKIAEKILLKGVEKASEITSKKVTAKIAGKIIGKAGSFIIGYLMDIPSVGSAAKVNIITEPAPSITGDINIEKSHKLNMDIELYTGDRAGTFIIKIDKVELDNTHTLVNELRYKCINEPFATYRFENINIHFQKEGIYLLKVFFPENELRNQYKIITKSITDNSYNFIGTWEKIGGGLDYDYDPWLDSYLQIDKVEDEYLVRYVTWHNNYRNIIFKTKKINDNQISNSFNVLVQLEGNDKLLFTIDPYADLLPIVNEIYIRNSKVKIIPINDEQYCEVINSDCSNKEKEIKIFQFHKHGIPVKAYARNRNIYLLYNNGKSKQVTFSGRDSNPVLSNDRKTITFIKEPKCVQN